MEIALISFGLSYDDNGVRLLATLLEKAGHRVKIIFPMRTEDSLTERSTLSENNKLKISKICRLLDTADIIGVSFNSIFLTLAYHYTREIKRSLPGVPVIWGGIHVTILPEESIRLHELICVGEGEKSFIEFVEAYAKTRVIPENVPGIWYRRGERIINNGAAAYVADLNVLPQVSYDLKNNYIWDGDEFREIREQDFGNSRYITGLRGCAYKCSFCAHKFHNYGKRKLRFRSVDSIIADLRQIKSTVKQSHPKIGFGDSDFFFNSAAFLREFAQLYKQEIGLPFQVTFSPLSYSHEKMNALCSTGLLSEVWIGIQTGSPLIRKKFCRGESDAQVLRMTQELQRLSKTGRKFNIWFHLIWDSPEETEKEIIETVTLMHRLPAPYQLRHHSLSLLPGSTLFDDYERENPETLISPELILKKHSKYPGRLEEGTTRPARIQYLIDLTDLCAEMDLPDGVFAWMIKNNRKTILGLLLRIAGLRKKMISFPGRVLYIVKRVLIRMIGLRGFNKIKEYILRLR